MRPYLIVDVTGSLYYHQSETQMADCNEDELSDSYGNLSVVASSSEDSVRKDELEIEHGCVVSRPVRCIRDLTQRGRRRRPRVQRTIVNTITARWNASS